MLQVRGEANGQVRADGRGLLRKRTQTVPPISCCCGCARKPRADETTRLSDQGCDDESSSNMVPSMNLAHSLPGVSRPELLPCWLSSRDMA